MYMHTYVCICIYIHAYQGYTYTHVHACVCLRMCVCVCELKCVKTAYMQVREQLVGVGPFPSIMLAPGTELRLSVLWQDISFTELFC